MNDRAPGATTQWIVLIGVAVVLVGLTMWSFGRSGSFETGPAGEQLDPSRVYDPVVAGEDLPAGYRQLLPRDAILPIYDPLFVPADQAGWPDDAQVLGVALGDEAKAYPISNLNRREMVIDELDGIPILVSW